jgi:hypothetical protein
MGDYGGGGHHSRRLTEETKCYAKKRLTAQFGDAVRKMETPQEEESSEPISDDEFQDYVFETNNFNNSVSSDKTTQKQDSALIDGDSPEL